MARSKNVSQETERSNWRKEFAKKRKLFIQKTFNNNALSPLALIIYEMILEKTKVGKIRLNMTDEEIAIELGIEKNKQATEEINEVIDFLHTEKFIKDHGLTRTLSVVN